MLIAYLWYVVCNNKHRTIHNSQLLDIALGLEYLHTFDPPIIHGDLNGVSVFPSCP